MIIGEEKISYDDVLLVPQYSFVTSRSQVSVRTSLGPLNLKAPIIASNMDTITGMKMARKMDELGGLGIIHRGSMGDDIAEDVNAFISGWVDVPGNGPLALSVGSMYIEREKTRIDAILAALDRHSFPHARMVICVDFAHGDSTASVDTIAYIREKEFTGTIIGGAVCTPDACKRLMTSGANAVRVGIGPGSACSTRLKTGCGYPQLSAIMECAETGVPVIADGGIRQPGDVAKALAAGAKAVMMGGQFAGTDCVPGWDKAMKHAEEEYEYQKQQGSAHASFIVPSIEYRGMASNAAKTAVGVAEGFEEGVSVTVRAKPKGSTEVVISNMVDGLRSAMSYSNALNLKEFRMRAEFVKISPAVMEENRAHIDT